MGNPGAASGTLQRHFGLVQATALNITSIVGAGVFVTIPLMLGQLPGPYALAGWLVAGVLIIADGLVWSELGAMLPGSGGSYLYLLEGYGRERWGRLMAFLFVWQFLLSGPLEIASGLIAAASFSTALGSGFASWNLERTWQLDLVPSLKLAIAVSPARLGVFAVGVGLVTLAYRRVTTLGRLTVTFWVGVLGVIAWILIEGGLAFDPAVAFDVTPADRFPAGFGGGLGAAMILAVYSYLGYYSVCYIGDEVRDPGRTMPRAILISAVLVSVLFTLLHLAMLGSISWRSVPTAPPAVDDYNLPAAFMRSRHGAAGDVAATLVTLLLMWSCFGCAFAQLVSYARIPFGAARYGHFFAVLGRIHPARGVPDVALVLVGGLTLFWCFFDLQNVISALITTRILEQFIGQVVGVVLLRRRQPERPRPYRMWLYPLPCGLALLGWLYVYLTAGGLFIGLGLATLLAGSLAFLAWSYRSRQWPFAAAPRTARET